MARIEWDDYIKAVQESNPTPAEHAATVRERLVVNEDYPAAEQALAALVAQAERATELERRLTEAKKLAREWEYDCRVARERAEQLERENEKLRKALTFYAKQDIAVVARAALDGGTT